MELNRLWKRIPLDLLNFVVRREPVRRFLLKKGEEKLYADFVRKNADNRPPRVQEARYLMLRNLLHSVNRALSNGSIAPSVSRALLGSFVGRILMNEEDRSGHFFRTYGLWPPAFLTISPTKKCNLFCTGCYASSSSGNAEKIDYRVLGRILAEKQRLWGSYFTVLSGGEPLLYRDGNKGLLDLVREHPEQYFMMYTNGTLITRDVARRMADLGNITPAISVEGFERETDERRGKGVFRAVLRAMENLRKAGVPFGISATATRHNVEAIMSDRFVDVYFRRLGAIYGWIFQYMPIGRSFTIDLMITPEQRLALFRKEEKMIRESNLFLVDFWNGGPYAVGCISAGRPGGYFYIDWNGNIAPCTFYPYYLSNINDLYRQDKTLNDVLFSPYFTAIRNWQNEYGYAQPPGKVDNLIVPCIIRDHFPEAFALVQRHGAKPMDEQAAGALKDAAYRRRMTEYGKTTKALTQKHWEAEFK